jgi:anti-sigma B factor antagonist
MSNAAYPIQILKGMPVVAAPEDIDITNADSLSMALLEASRGHASFVVDMTRTRFCDSAGLKVLVGAHKRARTQGGELRLVIPSVAVLRAFAITGVDRVIPHFSSVDDALAPVPVLTIQPHRHRPS